MELFSAAQLKILQFIQSFSYPHFVQINEVLSSLQGVVGIALMLGIYWTVSKNIGARIILLYLVSVVIVWLLKDLLQMPRPYMQNPMIQLIQVSGFGFPSADTCSATIIFGAIAGYFKRPMFYVLAVVVVLLVSYARLALGVHYPTDVAAGILLGLILLIIQFKIVEPNQATLNMSNPLYFLVLILLPLCLLIYLTNTIAVVAIGALSGFALSLFVMRNKDEIVFPRRSTRFLIALIGIIITFLIGYLVCKIYKFDVFYDGFIFGCWIRIYCLVIENIYNKRSWNGV